MQNRQIESLQSDASTVSGNPKFVAAKNAARLIESGMRVGLGSGSTAMHFVELLAHRIRNEGLEISAVATSKTTASLAERSGIELEDLCRLGALDIAVDGADEIDPDLCLIKGGGGALLREKIVAQAARFRIIIADSMKLVEQLGKFPLPVELISFGWEATLDHVLDACRRGGIRPNWDVRMADSGEYVTDEGNMIVDIEVGKIESPLGLAAELSGIAGVVEHGIFVNLCDLAIVVHPDGRTEYFGEELDLVAGELEVDADV